MSTAPDPPSPQTAVERLLAYLEDLLEQDLYRGGGHASQALNDLRTLTIIDPTSSRSANIQQIAAVVRQIAPMADERTTLMDALYFAQGQGQRGVSRLPTDPLTFHTTITVPSSAQEDLVDRRGSEWPPSRSDVLVELRDALAARFGTVIDVEEER